MGFAAFVLLAAAVVIAPASAVNSNSRSWAPPFHGRFTHSVDKSTGSCLGSRNTTTYTLPIFNGSTGVAHLNMESNTSGSFCPHSPSQSTITEIFGFTTHTFKVRSGFHHIAVTWSLRWFVQEIASGGVNGTAFPASAMYGIGVNGTKLCDTVRAACLVFPNSSSPGSTSSVGWSVSNSVTNSSYRALASKTVTLYLNTTFGGANTFAISSLLFASTSAHASHGTYHAQTLLLFNAILGGYVKLLSITVT